MLLLLRAVPSVVRGINLNDEWASEVGYGIRAVQCPYVYANIGRRAVRRANIPPERQTALGKGWGWWRKSPELKDREIPQGRMGTKPVLWSTSLHYLPQCPNQPCWPL